MKYLMNIPIFSQQRNQRHKPQPFFKKINHKETIMNITEDYFVEKMLPKLPQFKQVDEGNARYWFRVIMENEPDRLMFHYNRLFGLGGSDIGEIVNWKIKGQNTFTNPIQIVEQKLLELPPSKQDNYTRRGTYLEPVVARIFYEDYDCKRDEELYEAVNGTTFSKLPWLRGGLDDLVVNQNGDRFIVDYKVLSQPTGEVSLPYKAQLHQYDLLYGVCKYKQIHGEEPKELKDIFDNDADGLYLGVYDHSKGSVIVKPVELEQEIIENIIKGGNEIWNHVLNGTKPDIKKFQKEDLEYSNEEKQQIEILEKKYIKYKLLSDASKTKADSINKEIVSLVSKNGEYKVKGQKLPCEILSTRISQGINEENAIKILRDNNQNEEEFATQDKKLDENKILGFFDEQNVDPKEFYKKKIDMKKMVAFCEEKGIVPPIDERLSLVVSPKKNKLDKETLANMKKEIAAYVENQSLDFLFLEDSKDNDRGMGMFA